MGTIQIGHRYQKAGGEENVQPKGRDTENYQLEDYLYYPSWLKPEDLVLDLDTFQA